MPASSSRRVGSVRTKEGSTARCLRIEKAVAFPTRRDVSVFFDVYDMFNANPAQNAQWSSGTTAGLVTFNRPLSVVPPRLARIGVKLNF